MGRRAGHPRLRGRARGHQVRARREPQAVELEQPHSSLPRDAHGRRRVHPRALPGGEGLPPPAGRVPQGRVEQGRPADSAGSGPPARSDRRDPRGQAHDPLPLVPEGRDPPDDPIGRGVRRQGRNVPARPRGLQGRRRNRAARRRSVGILGLVGIQGRGLRRHSLRLPPDARARRARVVQLRRRRPRAAPEPRGRQGREVRQRGARRRAGVRDVEPGETARHRGARRLARDRQGWRLRDLERGSALDLDGRARDLDRGQEVLRPHGRRRREAGSRIRARRPDHQGEGADGAGERGDKGDKTGKPAEPPNAAPSEGGRR